MTTRIITARNVNEALHDALWWLDVAGIAEDSRNGAVKVAPGPVITEYLRPTERVLFSPGRNANPYFHLMEALWMLEGRNHVEWPASFNKQFKKYAQEDTGIVHGAYGYRWRAAFDFDQLEAIANHLLDNPESRRAVLTMWSPAIDLLCLDPGQRFKVPHDLPCNTHCYFDLRNGVLNLSVCCRSNDALWGAYGANAVHFSMLQEFMAAWVDYPVGVYRQFSHNMHIYTDMDEYPTGDPVAIGMHDHYLSGTVEPYPLVQGTGLSAIQDFEVDLQTFLDDPRGSKSHLFTQPFFPFVAQPMYASWYARRHEGETGLKQIESIQATDWRLACLEWIERAEEKKHGH